MAKKESFVLYTEQKAVINKLSDEQAGKLIKAIYEYVETGEMPELDNVLDLVITPFKTVLDKDKAKYEEVSKARAEAGSKGGKQNKQNEAKISKSKQKKHLQTKDSNCNDNDNEYDNDLKKKIQKKEKPPYTAVFEELWKAYPRRKDKALAYKAYKARLNDGFSEDELITAVKRYAEECRRQRTEERYIKHCSTFLGVNTPFTDYLGKEEDDEPENSCSVRLW